MSNIQLENGRINLEGLSGITDHLKALAITNITLGRIKEKLESSSDTESTWYHKATTAHKSWFWMRSRICERLSILRREEKELNVMRARFEDEELLALLRKQVTKADLASLRLVARAIAEERLQAELKKVEVGNG